MKSSIRIALVSFLILFFIPNLTSAETKTFIKEYTYQASEADSKQTSRILALEQVKRLLLEELGTYIVSKTVVKDFQLTSDQITVMAAGIVKTEIVNEEWDGKKYWLRAKISADPEKITDSIRTLANDPQKAQALTEEITTETIKIMVEMSKLREEIETTKSISEKKQKIKKYEKLVSKFERLQKIETAKTEAMLSSVQAITTGNWGKVIDLYKKIIELDPRYFHAYSMISTAYIALQNPKEALNFASKAIKTFPKDGRSYNLQGQAFKIMGNYHAAINAHTKAIKFGNDEPRYYIDRGEIYTKLTQYKKAIDDFDVAINLDSLALSRLNQDDQTKPMADDKYIAGLRQSAEILKKLELIEAYQLRGQTYGIIKNYTQAIIDWNKAIEIAPDSKFNAPSYYMRAAAYLGQSACSTIQQSINDVSKAIELDPKNPQYFCTRGNYFDIAMGCLVGSASNDYRNIGADIGKLRNSACNDFRIAANLGHKDAQENLKGCEQVR